jgi:hypothetical protein
MTDAERTRSSRWLTFAHAVAMAWPTFAAEQAARTWVASRRQARAGAAAPDGAARATAPARPATSSAPLWTGH